jgi:hypothetical protein
MFSLVWRRPLPRLFRISLIGVCAVGHDFNAKENPARIFAWPGCVTLRRTQLGPPQL